MSLDFWLQEMQLVNVFDANYTHNVTPMWREAGVYDALYNSEGKKASEIIPILERGLVKMRENPEVYEAMNPENGCGSYESAVPWLQSVLNACREKPDAVIVVWK